VLVDLPDTEERALNLALNSPAIAGEFTEGLGALLDEVQAADADLFDALMLGEMAEPAPVVAAAVDVEDAGETEPPSDPVARRGGMWRLGDHVLVCGDSRDDADVARLMAGVKSTIAVTSPPYASQRTYDESSGFRPIPPDDFVAWFEAVQRNVRAHMVEAGSWFVNIKAHAEDGQRHLYVNDLLTTHVRSWGWRFVDEICWYKRSLPGVWPDRLRNDWEPVFHFATAKGFPFNPLDVGHTSKGVRRYAKGQAKPSSGNIGIEKGGSPIVEGVARPGNVVEVKVGGSDASVNHSAAFPPALPEFFIKAYSDKGDVIYDPFCGSGSTLMAAHRQKRMGMGMEISPAYVDVIVARLERETGEKAVRVDG
jgi:DNA modification methylase